MQDKVLLLRTLETIEPTAKYLQEHGLSVVKAPVIKAQVISWLPCQISQLLARSHIICCLSQNALSSLRYYQGHLQTSADVWAVGEATRVKASKLFNIVSSPDLQTSEGLFDTIKDDIRAGTRVVLLKGLGGRDFLIRQLSQMGAIIAQVNLYQRVPNQEVLSQLPKLLGCQSFSAIMAGSGELLNTMLMASPENVVRTPVIVPSERVAEIAIEKGFSKVKIASGASANAFLSSHRNICI